MAKDYRVKQTIDLVWHDENYADEYGEEGDPHRETKRFFLGKDGYLHWYDSYGDYWLMALVKDADFQYSPENPHYGFFDVGENWQIALTGVRTVKDWLFQSKAHRLAPLNKG